MSAPAPQEPETAPLPVPERKEGLLDTIRVLCRPHVESLLGIGRWIRTQPAQALLTCAIFLVLAWFVGFHKAFQNGSQSLAEWAWAAWNPENNQEHSALVLPVSILLAWYHRGELVAAAKAPYNPALGLVLLGIALFVLGIWMIQPRFGLLALPMMLLGGAWFLCGGQVARILLFPCAFLLFTIPIGSFVQSTVSLQLLVTSICNVLAGWTGVSIEAAGTTIRSADGSFNFEIAEGCSGIRSLMAMTTATALYVHFTHKVIWQKVLVFCCSILFALVGNVGRIFTVLLVAKFISPTLAGGLYHDYSGYVFFLFAVSTMLSFSNMVSSDFAWLRSFLLAREKQPESAASSGSAAPSEETSKPNSYDY